MQLLSEQFVIFQDYPCNSTRKLAENERGMMYIFFRPRGNYKKDNKKKHFEFFFFLL